MDILPIFRSEAQFRLLGELFLDPDREWSLTELAERIDALPSSVSRETDRLVEAGLLKDRRQGNVRLVSARLDTPVGEHLRGLLVRTYGPAPWITTSLASISGIERAWIFGSWAARATGESGPQPQDVDLLVIGEVDPLDVYDVAREGSRALGIDINPVVRTPAEWEHDETEFARHVRQGPLVDVTPLPASSHG